MCTAYPFTYRDLEYSTFQVDIASTLAFLFGVPIPKNNVGTVMAEAFSSLEGIGFSRKEVRYEFVWPFGSVNGDDYLSIVLAYRDFLGTASNWLSSRSTDKPIGLLALGIAAMCLSCLGLMSLLSLFGQEVDFKESQHLSHSDNVTHKWHLDEYFIVAAGTEHIKSMHLLSLVLVITCLAVILRSRLKTCLAMLPILIYLFPAIMILKQILKCQHGIFTSSSIETTTMIQIIYALIGVSTVGILVAVPWLMPLNDSKTSRDALKLSSDVLLESRCEALKVLVQILFSLRYFSEGGLHLKHWVKVAVLYYMGMAGHFALGNTNTLATIDVAGAFIGISSHSTIISGILMFVITYASPMLALLSMLMDVSMTDTRAVADSQDVDFGHLLKMTIGYPCLVPLTLNSILLLAYTIVLLLMRNHLFVWSVFSPKYLYVCATTACVYIGVSVVAVTATYTCMVFASQRKLTGSSRDPSTKR
ncbi:hypothetical protein PHJA_001214200 [Phtheirospermum japonicum]|uniref:GPI ethanolamine phosphate transferase 2 C-terminal domain-containing protein n=1 Tax=Phtheirospermum japonicum TaxID=374723 RepID=A0A830C8Z1_9LAMI|nr:hypothetical protein PHJA_001214200 [Phtheirospermum japonicum]